MKQYKVGDTVYVKGTIVDSDCAQQYLIKSGDHTYGFWFKRDAIADLPEPVKPVLPKDVADELEKAKTNNLNFYGYMDHIATNQFTKTKNYISMLTSYTIELLFYAWYNGYTVEKEPRYKVYVTGTNKQYMYVKRGELAKAHNKKATPVTPQSIGNYMTAGVSHQDLYWFTDEEITKFDLQDCEKELVTDD